MTCELIRERLAEYVEDALSAPDSAMVGEHIASCAECRAIIHELKSLDALFGLWQPPPPPSNLWAGVAARIGASGSSGAGAGLPSIHISWWKIGVGTVLVVSGYLFWQSRSQPAAAMPLPRAQETLLQSHGRNAADHPFSDDLRDTEPAIARERGGDASICH